MSGTETGRKWPGVKKELREIRPYAAALGPDEQKLEAVFVNHTEHVGPLATAAAEPVGIWPEERLLDLNAACIEGWVAGVPVVDGVVDSGWQPCEGGRVRLLVRVTDCPEQKEWVRGITYGGAYAREVLGQAA